MATKYIPDDRTFGRNPYSVPCPDCGAEAGDYCRGRGRWGEPSEVDGVGYVPHSERWRTLSQTPEGTARP